MLDEERKIVITKSYDFIIKNNIDLYPIPIPKLCNVLNVELVKLSEISLHTGMTKEQIFGLWGNSDGVLNTYLDKNGIYHHKIAYNDSIRLERQRFTIMEECSHIILEHYKNLEFNMFNQSYSDTFYNQIDEEARMCAGFLVCPPYYYYNHASLWNDYISEYSCVLDITKTCARTRGEIYDKFSDLILKNELYSSLPEPLVMNVERIKKTFEILGIKIL